MLVAMLLSFVKTSNAQQSTVETTNNSNEISQTSLPSASGLVVSWPLDRMVVQRNSNNQANVSISIQYSDFSTSFSNAVKAEYQLVKVDNTTGNTNISIVKNWTLVQNVQSIISATGEYYSLMQESNLGTGWYKLNVKLSKLTGQLVASKTIKFGVGDVYFIAGQSNAAGYEWIGLPQSSPDNGLQAFVDTNQFTQMDAVSFLQGQNYVPSNSYPTSYPIKGFPVQGRAFSKLIAGDNNNIQQVYPNGRHSWCWAPLGSKIADSANVPVLFFNVAVPGTALESWTKNANNEYYIEFRRFRNTLQLFGGTLGTRGVIWHQGENEAVLQSNNDTKTDFSYYRDKIATTIRDSRSAFLRNPNNASLNWFVSMASYYAYPSDINTQVCNNYCVFNNNPPSLSPPFTPSPTTIFTKNSCPTPTPPPYNYTLTNSQYSTFANTNNQTTAIAGVRSGVFTDDMGESTRNSCRKVHITGNNLKILADRWYERLYPNNTAISTPIEGNTLTAISVVHVGGGNFKLSAPIFTGRKYFWTTDNEGIYAPFSTNREITVNNVTHKNKTFVCYFSDDNDLDNGTDWDLRLKATQPFVVPSKSSSLSSSKYEYTFSSTSGQINLESSNVIWNVTNLPSWITVTSNQSGGDGIFDIGFSFTPTAVNREHYVRVQQEGGTIYKDFKITQAAAGGTTTQLSSLTPTSAWQEWGTLQTNKSVEGNTLRIGNQSYAFGLGTHANSNIKYDLSGQYTTFSGKVGLDDEVDNSCGGLHQVRFVIKADGSTLYTSPIVTPTMAAVPFSVNVSGKNQLELIVEALDNFYCDHADWVDTQLVTGSGSGCPSIPSPTGVTASVATITAGQSTTLSATCGQGTVTWSTGQNANSITVTPTTSTTYSATCISGSCSSGSVSVAISVVTAGACTNLSNGLAVGAWQVTGHTLKVRDFHGQKWLTQVITTTPDAFVVRGASMLQRSDVTLYNSSYASQVGCFALQYSDYGGLLGPNETIFPTPAGFAKGNLSDGTPYYSAISAGPTCNNTFLTAEMATYKTTGDGTVHTNLNKNGTTLNINGTTYTKGIGTHAVSEIIYTIPPNQGFTTFMADVGRDQGAYGCNCGNQDIVFKVINNSTGAILAGPVTKGNYQSATALSANLSGVTSIKLIVEAGTDGAYWGDWANWANARLTCPNANARQINTETTETELFQILPNPNNGTFNVKIDAKTAGVVQFYLSNLNGVPLKNFEFNVELGVSEHTVSVENLLPSTYLLKAIQGEKVEAKRLVIE